MATASEAQSVKTLNTTPGRRNRRFVFKSFAQRIEELEIDVFRNLDALKAEPASGSSFFLDCLTQWRELNTAEDFISFYEEMMPVVQTLPLVLLHKDMIVSGLLSRLQLDARLSLEPILRLIAELSRDLQDEFLPFLPKIIESYLALLKDGADREPEIIEQIFTSWSYVVMYLQKYLTGDVVHILKVTVKLRYYTKDFVQEFMAEALSFLLRNAPIQQFIKGIRKVLREAASKPSEARKSAVSALLWHVMRGTSSKFHSRADRLMRLLIDASTLSIGDRYIQGSNTVTEIVSTAFQRSCMELDTTELKLLWECLYEESVNCVRGGSSLHLNRLLLVLISTVAVGHGRKVSDYKAMLELVGLLVQTIMVPYSVGDAQELVSEAIEKIFELMICILDGIFSAHNLDALPSIALQWAPAFQLRTSSLLTFLKELVRKDYALLAFRSNFLSGFLNVMEISREGGVYLMLTYCERLHVKTGSFNVLEGSSDVVVSKLQFFFKETISNWIECIKKLTRGDPSCCIVNEDELAFLWGTVCCTPHFLSTEGDILLLELVDVLDELLTSEADPTGGVSKHIWQSLIGAALHSYHSADTKERNEQEETKRVLDLARNYRSSRQILSAVANYLDLTYGDVMIRHPKLAAEEVLDALELFSENLYNPDKEIRVSTLRILSHYEPLKSNQISEQQTNMEGNDADTQYSNVFKMLLTIEETPVSVATSRKATLLVSRIQTLLTATRTSEVYVIPTFYGIVGLLHNQFMDLSNAALDCISIMLNRFTAILWDRFISIFELCQTIFLKAAYVESLDDANDLLQIFRSFCGTTPFEKSCSLILTLLLQALQKIPSITESHSRQVVPLFLKFMGYRDENPCVGSFNSQVCRGKDWKLVLMEWLSLFKLMKNARSFYRSQILKEILVQRLLDDNDADMQTKVLDCLLNWKDGFLLPYEKHLKNLVSSKYLREELATWSLSKESRLIDEEHRAHLVPLVTRLLMPKVRNLRTLASRKHASVNNRRAVLGFIAQLSVDELPLFFALLMKSLNITEHGSDEMGNCILDLGKHGLDESQPSYFLKLFTLDNIQALPWKKRFGFLHVVEEILGVFDATHVRPFLDLLMGCVIRILENCASSLDNTKDRLSTQLQDNSLASLSEEDDEKAASVGVKQFKDMRSLCLKISSFVLNKYEDHGFSSEFWDRFFTSVKPLIHAFKAEGASSEKPSSLFLCFLAMSQSQNLVPLLCREKNLIPDIFSILSVPTASEAMVSGVLKFTDNLLTLEVDYGTEENATREALLLNLESLVDSLHNLFLNYTERQRKLLKHLSETVLRVLKMLSKFIKDESLAIKFVDILLPLAYEGVKNSGVCMEALQILQHVVPLIRIGSTSQILNAVSPILIYAGPDLRLSICDLFDALAKSDASFCSMAKLIRELNATSATEMGDLDFDIIISAYEKVTEDYFCGVTVDQAIVILSHCIYDMTSEEIILRQSAYRSLLSFVEFSALVIEEELKEEKMAVDDSPWTGTRIQHVVNKFLLKHIGNSMSKDMKIRKEWIDLLHEMVLKLSGVPALKSLKVLCSDDAEVDFFNNIVHLQKHRRSRALLRFTTIVATGKVSQFVLKRVFIPLLFSMLFDLQAGKGEHIRSACLDALASISGQLGWKSYYELLMRCFREITKKPDREKVLIRLVCSFLDQFHFLETGCTMVSNIPYEGIESDCGAISASVVSRTHDRSFTSSIQSCLLGNVLPKLQKLLVSDPDKVNVNISVAILKVLKLLPGDLMDSQLSSIIHRISNFLKNRMESIREEARSALVACLKELGLEYVKFLVKVLMSTLKRGFEMHVLGYSLNFILSKCLPDSAGGELDHCLNDLLTVVDNDIFGEVAEQKDVEKVASKMKETRKQMSFNTLKLIAQNVTFKTHSLKLLAPVTAHLQKHLSPKVKLKLENMLSHIAEGIESNPSVSQTDLFIFIFCLVDDWLSEESRKSDTLLVEQCAKEKLHETSGKLGLKSYAGTETQFSYLITVFALGLFHNRLRKIKFDKGNDQLFSMLDPFIKLLTSCLSCKYEEIVAAALKCVLPLVRLPLRSLDSQADKIKVTLLNIAQSSSDVNSVVTQSCLKLLTALLQSTKITLSTDQLHVLIQFPLFVDLEKNPSFVALTLLKAIVRRKLVVHEIYDLVNEVAELMVTSQEEAIRRKCSQILLQFLLNYQMSQQRRQEHLYRLVAGLRYEHASGREAVLDMLKTVIKRFPDSIINEESEFLFVLLVRALANDCDSQVRSLIGIVIKLLISRVSSKSLDPILRHCLDWYLKNEKLWSTAAQVLGFVVEVMKRGFFKHIVDILPVMKRILQSTSDVIKDEQLIISDQETALFWKETYYSLVLLEKILTQMPDLFFVGYIEDIWQWIIEFLVHPHPWIYNISNRLLALYIEQIGIQSKKVGTTCLTSTNRLFLIAASLCCLLKAQFPDKGSRKLVKCNLAFSICGIQSLLCQTEAQNPLTFWSTFTPHEQGYCLKLCNLLGPLGGNSIIAAFTCGYENEDIEQKDNRDLSYLLISWLLNAMGKTALQTEDVQCKMILGSLKLIAEQLRSEDCQHYAIHLLLPIYKLSEGFAGRVVSDGVKQSADKVRQKMQEVLGTQNFLEVYSQIRHSLGEKRHKRKQDEKIMAVINPAQNAKRKMRMSAKHQAHKKRKIMSMKMGRWMH